MTGAQTKSYSKRRVAIISAISLALIALITVLAVFISGYFNDKKLESELKDYQSEMLEALELKKGEYDEQSIVLYGTNKREATDLAELIGAKLRITENGEFATLTLPEGTTILDVFSNEDYLKHFDKMSADWSAKISDVEENYERLPQSPDYNVSDELYAYQNYLNYLNLGNVWNSYKGSGVTVAVIDTGIDIDHPEFTGRISQWSYNASEDKIVKDYVLEDGSYDWSLIEDAQGHGTAVAGTIGAAMDGKGTVGIAPYVTIIVIKAECDENGNFLRSSDLVFGLYYAIERDVDVVNMSFGGLVNIYADAARLGRDSDILMVAATGNYGNAMPMYPAADENVIGVGALADDSWELADYSNYGESVDVVAPGTVYTTAMGGEYQTISGTSFSSPIVAATLALMKCNWSYRYSTNEKIIEILFASSYDLGDLGPDYYYGYGALDVYALLEGEQGTVTFDYLTDEIEETNQVFISGNPLQNIPEPERLYAIFEGWYYDIECTEPLDLYRDAFKSDLTLYAKWINENDGVPYTYVVLDDGTIEIRSYTGHRKYITVPEIIDNRVVSSIGDFAFAGQSKLREVTLPKTITHIGLSAFEGCSNLVSMNIPDSVVEIESSAFRNNIRLGYVNIGSQSSLKNVGDFAFEGCSKLKTIDLPSSLEYVNGSAFYGTTSMTKINVANENEHFISVSGVLFNKSKTELIAYPAGVTADYKVPDITRTIGDYAFAFSGCSSIELSETEAIGVKAFEYSSLKKVIIPDSVTSLGAYAFSNCYNLSDITIGVGLTNIESGAFAGDVALKNVYIPANIVAIKLGAFSGAGLQAVEFAENSQLLTIGDSAFTQTGIRNIAFPRSLVSIGNRAFEKCYWLSAVSFEEGSSLQAIGGSAFALTVSLKEISFPETLRVIGDYAFDNSGLTGIITIPETLEYFGAGAFASCHGVTAFEISGNDYYQDIDGVVYTTDGKMLVAYPVGSSRTNYTVVNGTETIGVSAFEGSNNLQHVTVCEGVTSIEEYAFYKCGKVYGYSLPSTLTEINAYAFSENSSLQSISIPKNVTTIGRYAFAYDYSLNSINIPDDTAMARISFATFAHTGIRSFRVPANVSSIAQYAFEGCCNLQSVTFAKNSKLESVSAYMFKGAENIRSITFESGSALTSIQAHGFEGMTNLQSVNFGDAKLTNIDNYAFRYCSSLTSLNLPETVENIGRFAFYKCTSLSELIIPVKTEHIGSYAFYGTNNCNLYFASDYLPLYLDENWDHSLAGYYTGVTDVITDGDWRYAIKTNGNIAIIEYLGSDAVIDLNSLKFGKIETIGGYAFASSDITAIILPKTLVEIQRYAFAYTKHLTSIAIPENVRYIASHAFLNSGVESLVFEGNNVEVIERYAFALTEKLASVTIPASVNSLGSYVFYQSGIETLTFAEGFSMTEIPESAFASTNITSVIIPDSITRIQSSAFRDNLNLKSVTIGSGEELRIDANAFYNTGIETLYITDNVRYIGEYAFVGLENLKNYVVSENNTNYSSADGVLYNKDKTKLIAFPAGREGSFEVPAHVENIGFGAFENSHLSSVTFADGINLNTIGWRAFFNAGNLAEITLPESLISIDYYAFAGCKNLVTVNFAQNNKLKGIYEGAFFGCQRLQYITIPDSIVEISEYAFYGCMSLDHLPVSETSNIKGIFDYAFAYTGITDLRIPEGVIDIGNYAFCGALLEKVYIPATNDQPLIIGIGAFADCNYLEEITLPFIGASFEDETITWFGYIFGAGGYEANATYVPESLKIVNIHDGITKIPKFAFYGLENIEEISVPHSVMHVGRYAFSGTEAKYELTNSISVDNYIVDNGDFGKGINGKLTLAEGVTSIASNAFYGFSSLESIVIPDSVTSIGNYVFYECSSLESLTIPNSVTSIGNWAFYGCISISSVVIPDSVTSINEGTFDYCTSLNNVVIPNSVTSIDSYAFGGCISLENIAIPASVTSIGSRAFSYCTSLKNIEIPDFVTNIGDYAFFNCTSLENITIPDSITSIGNWAFYGCTSLESVIIPDSVTNIGEGTFAYCTTLKNVKIPEGVTSIGDNAFWVCTSLESIEIPDTVTNIGSSAFSNCKSLKSIAIPKGVTSIEGWTFYYCTSLKSIEIPNSVTNIDTLAFSDCTNLTKIVNNGSLVFTFGSSEYGCIAENAKIIQNSDGEKIYRKDTYIETEEGFIFEYENGKYTLTAYIGNLDVITLPESINSCTYEIYEFRGAKHVIIPEGVTSIGDDAFSNCTPLESIEIPGSVTSIGASAFFNCTSLESISLPEGVTSIGSRAFGSCLSLEKIDIPSTVSYIGENAFASCESLVEITIPQGVEHIYYGTFFFCKSLQRINIPDTVISIGSQSFQGCSSLTELSLPEGITTIYDSAFDGCSSITKINIPDSLKYIYGIVFSNTGVSQIDISSNHEHFVLCDGVLYSADYSKVICVLQGVKNVVLSSNMRVISGNCFAGNETIESVIIPEGVTTIGYGAFRGCTNLKNVVIPETVTDIKGGAFTNCSSLASITLPSGVTSIESQVFWGCSSLKDIAISGLITSIGSGAFHGCTSLESIKIPDSVTSIGSSAFSSCTLLENIEIPKGVTNIGDYTFHECTLLKNVEIPISVTSIGSSAFSLCKSLESIKIPEGVTNIGEYAFSWCNSLKSVVIPVGVTSVSSGAFQGCISLESIEIPNSVTSIGYAAFDNCTSLKNVEIPEGVTSIGDSAFNHCTSLESMEIPEGVTSIGEYVFWGSSLCSIVIPKGVTSISDSAFCHCTYLTKIINNSSFVFTFGTSEYGCIAENAKIIQNADGKKIYRDDMYIETEEGFLFEYKDGIYTLIMYTGTEDTVTLPKSINGCSYEIYRFRGAKHVIIPEGVTSIGYSAFNHCTSLESIIIPDSVTSIGDAAFYDCTSLESIIIPDSVTSIGYAAFDNCTSLKNVEIPEGVTSIGYSAFNHCTSLESIIIPDSVTSIGGYVFDDTAYHNNESNWNDGMLYIGNHLIDIKEDISAIVVPDNTKCIAADAFSNCYLLKNLTIGGDHGSLLNNLTNLETLTLTSVPSHSIYEYFGYYDIPITLSKVILKSGCEVNQNSFEEITGITIFVEDEKLACPWDEDCPGWNNGNKVVYGGDWYNINYYDDSGKLITTGYYGKSEVIKPPYVYSTKNGGITSEFVGWDLDGNGVADNLPATINRNYDLYAVVVEKQSSYTVKFMDKDGKTVLHSYQLPYGAAIPVPEAPTKVGYSFICWIDLPETVTEDIKIYSQWTHDGDGHNYAVEVIAPSCTSDGYTLHVCTICGESYKSDKTLATGHEYGDWIIELEATCHSDGWKYRECHCGEVQRIIIDSEGHNYEVKSESKSSCTRAGTITYRCTDCGDELTEGLPLAAHSFEKKYASKSWLKWLIETLLNIIFGYEGDKAYYYQCKDCKHIATSEESDQIGGVGAMSTCQHQLGDWVEVLAPTCLDGYKVRYCTLCNEVIEAVVIEANSEHNYIATITDPTCIEDGYTTHDCSICGHSYVDSYVSKLGHTETDVVVENNVEPTCTIDGSFDNVVYCTVCDEELSRETITIDAVGHTESNIVVENNIKPDCTNNGYYDNVIYCTACGGELSRETIIVDALGHTKSDIVIENNVEPTCTTNGSYYNVVYCATCGEELSRETVILPALGHDFSEWSEISAPTCTTDGAKHRYCLSCDYNETNVIEALGHNYSDEWTIDVEPTCTSTGSKSHHCTECDAKTDVTTISRKDHEYGEWTIRIEATCERSGYMVASCKGCGRNVRETIEALGHDCIDEWYTNDPECTRSGSVYQLCLRCGDKVNATEIPALGHDFGEWEVVFAPTCTSTGMERRYCSRCHVFESRDIDTIAHAFENYVSNNDATCTANGTETAKCDRCDETDTRVSIGSAIGHVSGSIVVENNVDPTCINNGSYDNVVYCTVCNEELSRETITIDALGHDYKTTWSSNSTSHWYECYCGAKSNIEKHVFDNSCDVDCNKCGFTRSTKHSFDQGVITKEPTTTEKGRKTYTCTVCGEKKYEDIDKLDEPDQEPSGGCYIATSVYGSYDCPEVWTLRRFRDNVLVKTWLGRAFVKTYYAVSPTLVEWFGETNWFQNLWRAVLDVFVDILNGFGFENTPYHDQKW